MDTLVRAHRRWITSGDAEPLVSVITPTYNGAATLPYACESVLAQTLVNFELILIDDASTDETSEVIAHYEALDPRIRALRNSVNSRQAEVEWEPRNDGIGVARGSLVAYLDDDNTWDPRFLEHLATALMQRPWVQLAYCRSRNFHDPLDIDPVIAGDSRTAVERGLDWVVFAQDEIRPEELGSSQYVDTNEMMHRMSAFGPLGHRWRVFHPRRAWVNANQGAGSPYRRHNDLDLVERFIEVFGPQAIIQIPEVLVNYYYPSARRARHPLAGAFGERARPFA
ncbi:MAG TPA: glycosyltransferase family A protein [Pilimelia sp.]|jgi:glycosyltransferase involved in cell wall biosynthesis|nr:glycosyltransferase family A protein [Pilimelia sp.]